jgi:hypothetical protein
MTNKMTTSIPPSPAPTPMPIFAPLVSVSCSVDAVAEGMPIAELTFEVDVIEGLAEVDLSDAVGEVRSKDEELDVGLAPGNHETLLPVA